MDYKPTITYSFSENSDESLFLTLSTHLRKVLQHQPVQWKRSYGRTRYELLLDVKFLPLTTALLKRTDLVTRPYFHVFWTDCKDLDFYRMSVKGEISSWLSELSGLDWVIVVVTGDGTSTRSNKSKLSLPRTSLADKIKTDFCSKNPGRIHILQDPMKESSKTNDSWSSLATKLANFTALCLEDAVTKYEDRVRAERERRNEKTWTFCSYFIMQEELAFMFEMLSLHEEALIQYNELDAMFTQYLLNAHAGDVAHWLSSFMKPITRWHSLSLWRRIDGEARQMLIDDVASLIDVRNYLFARHCHLLFAVQDMKRMTALMHTFLHATTLELDILEIELPPGAKDCWVFMSCMELAQSIERTRDHFQKDSNDRQQQRQTGQEENPDLFMKMEKNDLQLEIANLWNLARSKLLSLGELCGLMPDISTSSENLQTVVDLISGMGEEEERDGLVKTPSLILREALSSKENFRSQYLELSELAMGTFKHMERYRSARNIGRDLAMFYMRSDEPEKAESFFLDCVRMYANDAWPKLMADASEKLAECYKRLCNVRRYVRLCCALMCNQHISREKRSFYCDELRSLSTDFGDNSLPILLAVFASVSSVQFVPAQTIFRHKSTQHLLLHVHSNAPKAMHFHSLQLGLRRDELSTTEGFSAKTAMSEILDEERELDVLSYTTFSSDEDKDAEPSSMTKKTSVKNHTRKRRRYLSTSSYDSMYAIAQKTPMGSDGIIQLIPMDEPFSQPSKCVANRMSQMIPVAYETEEKEDEISWAGITCRSARQLLRRQDSYQSLCSIHSSATNIVMEAYSDNLSIRNVTIRPGDNTMKILIDTAKAGHYTLRQLRFSIDKIHFVLPRILPVIAYTVTKDKPTLTLEHEPRLYCNIGQTIRVRMGTGDYELNSASEGRVMVINFPKHMKILKIAVLLAETEKGVEVELAVLSTQLEETKCSLELPLVPVHSIIIIEMCCVCLQPVTQDIVHRHHRRTHSAPPTTVHRHVQTAYENSGRFGLNGKLSSGSDNGVKLPQSPLTRRSGESPVKKFLTFVREVADRVDVKTSRSSEKRDVTAAPFDVTTTDDFLEVTLEECGDSGVSGMDNHVIARNRAEISKSSSFNGSIVTESSTASDVMCVNSLSSGKNLLRIPDKEGVPSSYNHPRHVSDVHEECSPQDENKVLCNVSFSLPWDDLPLTSTSTRFAKLLEFSHRTLRSHLTKNTSESSSTCLCQIVSITAQNMSPQHLWLKNWCLKLPGEKNVDVAGFLQGGPKKIGPSHSMTFAWKVEFSSSALVECNALFHVDVSNAESEPSSVVTPVTYKFEIENIQTLYTVSTEMGETEEELVCGQMTVLKIKVERIRRDPEHEHTRGGQQLLMYQVIDTRGRWAVCGKSTGTLSVPLSCREASELGPPIAVAELEIMPLVDGFLHMPVVVLQRYIKRRSGELDEHLSSTESPVLKPPRLMDFRYGEVVNIDEYRQVRVLSTPSKQPNNNGAIDKNDDGDILSKKTKL